MEDNNKCRSVVIRKFGGYESLLVEDFDLPPLEANVEVNVQYGGFNFADLYTRQGFMRDIKLPLILGMECAGSISAIGNTETDLKVGQGVICYDYHGGMFRDKVRISPEKCFPLPDYVDTKTGAAIFVNYLTAYFALIQLGHLQETETVLIQSCAGGVGYAATQLARMIKGVIIIGTGSPSKEDDAKTNGVDVFLSNEVFETSVKEYKFDLIIANESGAILQVLQDQLNPLGRIVLLGAKNLIEDEKKLSLFKLLKSWWGIKPICPVSLIMNNRAVSGLHLGILIEKEPEKVRSALDYIFRLYKEKKISPKVHSIWPMEKILDATKVLIERRNVGKVLIAIE